jgi:hypothetical protein
MTALPSRAIAQTPRASMGAESPASTRRTDVDRAFDFTLLRKGPRQSAVAIDQPPST